MTHDGFVFAGGGTGGHLYPAIAIAQELWKLGVARERCIFLCSERPLDAEILSKERVVFAPIPAAPFGLRPRAAIRFLRSWGASVRASRAIIRREQKQGPLTLVAMGGFVAAPGVQAARAEHIPRTLVNLDAVPGLANRWISKRAGSVMSACEVSGYPTWRVVRPIVRHAAIAPAEQHLCRERFGLAPDLPVLLVTGGSQGARSVNEFAVALATAGEREFKARGWQVIHQVGKHGSEEIRQAWERAGVRAFVAPFIDEMGAAWGAAELAISRAGAGNVGEVWANRAPTIFMPFPYHKDQHQKRNARSLVAAGGAVVIEDFIDAAANIRAHAPLALELLGSVERLATMARALRSLGPADGAQTVARALLDSRTHKP